MSTTSIRNKQAMMWTTVRGVWMISTIRAILRAKVPVGTSEPRFRAEPVGGYNTPYPGPPGIKSGTLERALRRHAQGDLGETLRVEGGAADQGAVDVRPRQQLGRVVALHAPA